MQRILREEELPAPSLRLSRDLDRLASTAAARQAEPARLSALVRGELDWVVMKALEKDRARRYESPAQFALDVARHLAGEAVIAAPPSNAYRLRKLIKRNKGPVAAAGLVAAASRLYELPRELSRELFSDGASALPQIVAIVVVALILSAVLMTYRELVPTKISRD